jgi:hypothetical protein
MTDFNRVLFLIFHISITESVETLEAIGLDSM